MKTAATTQHTLKLTTISLADLCTAAGRARMDEACARHGAFLLTGHGIESAAHEAIQAGRDFFDQSDAEKRQIERTRDNPWGYYDRELTHRARDQKEVFDFGPPSVDGRQVPQWPAHPASLQPAVRRMYRRCLATSRQLMQAMERNLGARSGELMRCFGARHASFLRINHYPGTATPERVENVYGVGAHTDLGALTLLIDDGNCGLEIVADGAWHRISRTAEAIVVNLGDVAQVWSNDRYPAVVHRVPVLQARRVSVPFFFNPDPDTRVAPLPSTTRERPSAYHPVPWGEFRASRARGDYEDLGQEVRLDDYRRAS